MKYNEPCITIAIVDDHPLVINGLVHMLANHPGMRITGTFGDSAELLAELKKDVPHILLLDIHMPGQNGDEIVEPLRTLYPDLKIIALTNQDHIYYIKTMLSKGVNGYVLKTAREQILLDAISSVSNGETYIDPSLREKLALDKADTRKTKNIPLLSSRERQVLGCIALNLTSQEIADKLFLSKRTIDNLCLSLLTKLEAKNAASMVKKALQLGLIT